MEDTLTRSRVAAPSLPGVDPVGMWYIARARHGISDDNWFGFARRGDDGTESFQWTTLPHRDADGIGAMGQLLQEYGYRGGRTPTGRDTAPPTLREVLAGWWQSRAADALPATADIHWHYLDPARAGEPHITAPVHVFLGDDEYARLRHNARVAGSSATNWLAWTLDRSLRQTLVDADSRLRWVFPVNLRGAVQAPAPHMNHCSGLTLVLDGDTPPGAIAGQLRTRFALHEHWRSWLLLNLGRWIGQHGVNLVYRHAREQPGSWAGSYSNLGAWPLPGMARTGPGHGDPVSGAICSSPGSPAYPVSTGIVEWQGRLALACRVHPVADRDGRAAARLLHAWQALACAG